MGDINQILVVQRNADLVRGPILEVGSKDYGTTQDFRSLFPHCTYVGTDMSEGKGVDVVLNLTDDFAVVDEAFGGRRFNTVICFSVLEHCNHPFKMCENLTKLLEPGGTAFIGVPFAWQVHGYPSDYWRFTAEGIKVLFPVLEFDKERACMATDTPGQIKPIDDFAFRVELSVSFALRRGDYGFLRSLMIRAIRRLRLLPFIFDHRYLHPPVMINMIGCKR